MLRKIKVDKGDVIYVDGEFSEEIYFIKQGKVKLFATNGFPFLTCKDGEHFGD
jgi:CRP-like cAMP-binding protein